MFEKLSPPSMNVRSSLLAGLRLATFGLVAQKITVSSCLLFSLT
jgi:hypothetical protein